jgi:hypothetical protein
VLTPAELQELMATGKGEYCRVSGDRIAGIYLMGYPVKVEDWG